MPAPCGHSAPQSDCTVCAAAAKQPQYARRWFGAVSAKPRLSFGELARKRLTCAERKKAGLPCSEFAAPGVGGTAVAPPVPGVLDQGGSGIGDGLLGMLAAEGLRLARPDLAVSYRCGPVALPYVRLFAGWQDVRPHAKAHNEHPVPGAAQINQGYSAEGAHPETRIARYCRHAGAPGPQVPALADEGRLRSLGQPCAGAVLLAPFSRYRDREWPLSHWLALERELLSAGCRVVILHSEAARCDLFAGERLVGADAATVTGAVLCADMVIANDSGMAHLAGVLSTPAVALCGAWPGAKVYSAYPSVAATDGMAGVLPAQVRERALAWLWRASAPHTLLSPDKLQGLARAARDTAGLDGAMAELGTFRGGSALLLARESAGRVLHVFDALGIPEDDVHRRGHKAGEFAATEDEIRARLAGYDVAFHFGLFPTTTAGLDDLRFSLVHLDADTLQSTRAALEWFGPRMLPGGQLVLDDLDWPHCPGVRQSLIEVGLGGRVERTALYQGRIRF